MNTIIDAHLHLDQYKDKDIKAIIKENKQWGVEAVITVSTNQASAEKNLHLSQVESTVFPAFGYHPEQPLPTETELVDLLSWMNSHCHQMVAVGEVGLPYYLRQNHVVDYDAYKELLTLFIEKAAEWHLPIVLHAIYRDAEVACDLLETYSIKQAHFHWFKGNEKTIERLRANGYHISFTPDICYKPARKSLVERYPLELIMVETDGPWPFGGPFAGMQTRPKMIRHSVDMIAKLKNMPVDELSPIIRDNTQAFYRLHTKW